MTPPEISIATSVVPGRDQALQDKAIASWMKLGFAVVSVNAPQEVAQVKAAFPNLTVVPAKKTAEKMAGKPLPFISDLLRAARDNNPTAKIIGVINADIVMRDGTDFAQVLDNEATAATVMLPRVDVSDLAACDSFQPTGKETFSVGYDGVFMPAQHIATIPESIFCIGMPFWDYWLPLMTLLQGQTLKSLASPIALHVTHETRWDKSIYVFFHALVGDMMKVLQDERRKASTPALEIVSDILQHSYNDIFQRATGPHSSDASMDTLAAFYDRIQEVVVHHIKGKAQPIKVPELS